MEDFRIYRRRPSVVPLAALLALSLIAADALGAQWRLRPRITVSETWSDNINLSDANPEHEFITDVTPGIGLTGRGARLSLDFDYQASLIHYARDTDDTRIDHRLQLVGNTELVDQRLFLDFETTVGQRNLSAGGILASDTLTVSDNTRDFFTYSVSPYVVHHFGNYADGLARYRNARVVNERSTNSNIDEFTTQLTSGRRFSTLPWTLSASSIKQSNSSGSTNKFRSVNGSVSRAFDRRYTLRVNLGYEDDDDSDVSTFRDTSGITWRVTGIWTPNQRTLVELGYGGRYFGSFPTVFVRHQRRRAIFTARYNETATTTALQQLETRLIPLEDVFGVPIVDPGLQDIFLAVNVPTVTDQTLISKRFDTDVTVRGRRTTGSLGAFHFRRDFQVTGGEERVYGVNGGLSRQLSRGLTGRFSADWQDTELVDSTKEQRWSVRLSLSKQIFRDLSGRVTYRHIENDSDTPGGDYSENRVSASLTMLF